MFIRDHIVAITCEIHWKRCVCCATISDSMVLRLLTTASCLQLSSFSLQFFWGAFCLYTLSFFILQLEQTFRSRPGKPNQRKGQNEKFMNFAHFCEFWCFSLGKQARFTYRTFVPECPYENFVNWLFLVWFAGATPDLLLTIGEFLLMAEALLLTVGIYVYLRT